MPVARVVQLASHLEQKRLADIAYETRRFVRIGESDVVINQRIADKSQPILKIYHYHCNHLGTPQELSDEKGDVIWLSYDRAWGGSFDSLYKQQFVDNFAVKENELQPFKFQGQSLDIETGLHYNRFRYYDSDVGMFVSRDPIGLLGGDNVFSYAPNPIQWIDPLGLKSTTKTNNGKCPSINFLAKDSVTSRWVTTLTGKHPDEVETYLINQGFTKHITNQNSPKLSHIQFHRRTKAGSLLVLDYNPVGALHGVPYWKVFKNDILQGRIAPNGFGKYDKIKEPLYINKSIVNRCS